MLILTDDGRCVDMFSREYEAVELQPHGRLIDADKMCADLATVDPQYETMIGWCIRVTQSQPTIIEAEDGEE